MYNISKADINNFAIYYTNNKDKLKITKLIYAFCLFWWFNSLTIMRIQINNILILVNDSLASNEKKLINEIKIITKDFNYFAFI